MDIACPWGRRTTISCALDNAWAGLHNLTLNIKEKKWHSTPISVVFKLCKKEVNTLKEDNVIINENSSNVIYSAVSPLTQRALWLSWKKRA